MIQNTTVWRVGLVTAALVLSSCGGKPDAETQSNNVTAITDDTQITASKSTPDQTKKPRKSVYQIITVGMSADRVEPVLQKVAQKSARYQFGPHWRSDLKSPVDNGRSAVWLHSVKVANEKIVRVGVVWDEFMLPDQVPSTDPHARFVSSLREGDSYRRLVERLHRLNARVLIDWEFSEMVDGKAQRYRITIEDGKVAEKRVLPSAATMTFAEK
ncbi:MAG: hypothetical protein HKM24_06300 [Gammaproteobacteria bacterium]|nr:hypothetical protein [Gammaproteobacteria bacterium]